MTMVTMIEHGGFNPFRISVRDDLIEGRVACVYCKGRGERFHCTGGGLWSTEYTAFRCIECGGRGHWVDR